MSSQNNAGREAAETAQAMMKAKTGQSGSTPAESAIQKQTEAMSPFLENGKQGEAQDVRFSTGGEDGYMECSGSEAGGYANPDGSALDTAQLGHYVSGDEVAGRNLDPAGDNFGYTLSQNAETDSEGTQTAQGYFLDADGASHEASFTKGEGDSSWQTTMDGKAYDSPAQAAQALDAGSVKTFDPSSKGLETQLGKSTQSDAYGNQTAKGYLEGADGRKHEAVYTKSAGEKGWKATVGGREYKSVEEAAKAVGAKSAGVYGKSASAGVYGKGKPATAGVYGKGDAGADGRPVQMSAVAQKGLNPSGKEMARVLDEHSHFEGTGAAASQEAYGSMTDVHGNSHEFKAVKPSQSSDWQAFEKTADGYVPRGSLGTMASDVQAASADVYQAEPGIISAQTIRASGSMANAMNSYNRTAGSGMPEPYLDQRVVSMGNGQVSGVYVDMGGNVKTYSGSVVSQNYAQKTPGNYIKVNDSVVSVRQGTKDAATLNYARSHEYKGGRWMDTGNAPTKLNNDAKARRQKK
ncbi:MAG: hypothetical protein LUE14_04615 [Clostridiales bacterium]|nr:hypothetical protein [Clostridiales bacterium]